MGITVIIKLKCSRPVFLIFNRLISRFCFELINTSKLEVLENK
jgi:hypothetical protein